MHCPKCGQQTPDEIQFCSKCGFALSGVKSLLESEGKVEIAEPAARSKATLSPRQRGVRLGAKLIVLFLLLVPVYPLFEMLSYQLVPSVENSMLDELPIVIVRICYVLLLIGGFTKMLYARLFESAVAPLEEETHAPSRLFGSRAASALPPPRSIPVSDFTTRRVNTGEVVRPPSVTDHTTRSLGGE